MKKIIVPGFLAGAAMLAASLVLNPVFAAILPELQMEYQNPALFRPWSDPLMSLIFVHPFVVGVILAWVWDKTKKIVKTGVMFGIIYWIVALPGMLISYSSFLVSLIMVLSWSLSGLLQALTAGIILAKINK